MNEIYANAYQEVIEVLKYTKKEDLIKIPKFKINLYKKYMNKNNNFKIDKSKPLEEQNISNEAKAILANLYKDYWATDYEKQRIDTKENYDLEQIAKEKYSVDNLFKKKEIKRENVLNNETSMIVMKKEKWYNKLINKIKNIFHKDNSNKLTNEKIKQIEDQKNNGEPYSKMFDDEYRKMTVEEKEQTDNFMRELDKKIGVDNDDEEMELEKDNYSIKQNIEINKLQQLIEENSGPDSFWADCLNNYFKNVNKTEKEKIEFLSNLIINKSLFNEFTKDIVNPANADEIFEKYKTISDKNINNYKFYKQNDTDLIWWVDNHEQRGERLFTFDKKRIFNLFKDYPQNLSKEEKKIFDKENPYWRDFFIKKS